MRLIKPTAKLLICGAVGLIATCVAAVACAAWSVATSHSQKTLRSGTGPLQASHIGQFAEFIDLSELPQPSRLSYLTVVTSTEHGVGLQVTHLVALTQGGTEFPDPVATTVIVGWPLPWVENYARWSGGIPQWMRSTLEISPLTRAPISNVFLRNGPRPPMGARIHFLPLAANLALLSVGLYVVVVTRSRIGRVLRLRRNHCPHCNYNLAASPTICPECGWNRPAP